MYFPDLAVSVKIKDLVGILSGETFWILTQRVPFWKKYGHGHNSAIIVNRGHNIDLSAHNDFLEVLFVTELIGLILYLLLHIYLIKRLFFLKRNKSELFLPYLASYITMFIMSMVSHLILYPTYFTFLATFWGAVEGQLYKKRFGVSG